MRFFTLPLVVAALGSCAFAADPGLLSLVMPDAKIVVGIEAAQARNSPFGQYVLSHMQANDANLNNFISQTGFDPRTDVTEMILASNSDPKTPHGQGLVLIKGVFDVTKLTAAAQAHGGTILPFQGLDIISYPARNSQQFARGIVFLDSSTAITGDIGLVETAIQQRKSNIQPSSSLLDKIAHVSGNNDFWFVSLVPISQFSAALPDPNLRSALGGNVLASINQLSGGVSLANSVAVSIDAVANNSQNAQSLADVLKFAASLVQLNSQNNPQSAQIAALLSTLNTTVAGNVTSISFSIPEQQLEQLLATLRPPQGRPMRRRVRPQLN